MFRRKKQHENLDNDIWVKIAIGFLFICGIIVIVAYEIAKEIYELEVPSAALLLWHERCFYIFCFSVFMLYFSLFKAFSFVVREEGILDYNYLRFLDVHKKIHNPFMSFYLRGRLLINWVFIILYWVIVGRLLWTFQDYRTVLNVYVIGNMLIIAIGELGRYYYIKKAKRLDCLPEQDIEKDKAIKDMDMITYIVLAITCVLASFFMVAFN